MKYLSDQVVRTIDVIGKKVIDNEQVNLGKIEEIVLDRSSGKARYAVLSFGGFMGMGADFYALPWHALSYRTANDAFEINVDKEKLKTASGFNKDSWPDFADSKWNDTIQNFYKVKLK